MNINLVELLENLTDNSRNTKELVEHNDKIKIFYKGAEIICTYIDPTQEIEEQITE